MNLKVSNFLRQFPLPMLEVGVNSKIVYANNELCKLLGFKRRELEAQFLDILLDEKIRLLHRKLIKDFFKNPESRLMRGRNRIFIYNKKGEAIPCLILLHPYRENKELQAVAIVIAIKEIIRTDTIAALQHSEAERRYKEEMLRIFSHDLRAPITTIESMLNLNKGQSTISSDLVDDVTIACEQAFTTIDAMSETLYTTTRSVARKKLRMLRLLNNIWREEIAKSNYNGGSLNLNFSEWKTIEYPYEFMESIFRNLIENSIRYASVDRALQININTTKNKNDKHNLEYQDNGSGLKYKKDIHKIFNLHSRFHGSLSGKGIGLYMVRSQIESQGGQINLKGDSGSDGLCFVIEF